MGRPRLLGGGAVDGGVLGVAGQADVCSIATIAAALRVEAIADLYGRVARVGARSLVA